MVSTDRVEPGAAIRPAPGHSLSADAKRRSLFVPALVVACVVLTGFDLALVFQNRELSAEVRELTQRLVRTRRPTLIPGDPFPSIGLFEADGRPASLHAGESEAGVLLFVSSTSCGYCDDVRPLWNEIARTFSGPHLRVVELVLDVGSDVIAERDAPFPALTGGDDVWSLVDRMPGIPAAILVDASGKVHRTFYGTDHSGLESAVEDFLLG